MMPNDELEQERMELLHQLYKVTFDDRLCQCPKNDGARHVLDIGTGIGAWALEYADRHPEAQVDGVDLSPIQPNFVSPNCRFLIDDIEHDWVFSDSFDFIFARAMLGTWGIEAWERLVAQAFRNLEPGGYFEIQDTKLPVRCDDGTLPDDSQLVRWDKRMRFLGLWAQHCCKSDLESLCLRLFTHFLDWTAEEVREFCASVLDDFDNMSFHAYWDV
ncbi:hypothetical protein MAPG_07244 [Magnaporthiopsis poae ATCC 64411]|uniref:Methyltransferase domain-containing protein n=1 Tax=Magnaporthiopsis poae (strain ATCC 64411 / 73-15) TaxID=644358 RepID=A0A0C4E455_MAGP6|nr:hypothetical protein MAPG_07244 [Magnaporthiopsis poae ATCC 64411]